MCATGRPNIVFAMMDQLKTSKYILAALNQTFENTQKMTRKTIKDMPSLILRLSCYFGWIRYTCNYNNVSKKKILFIRYINSALLLSAMVLSCGSC